MNKMHNSKVCSFRYAFTLVELLVVISIIAILLAVLMPALNKSREQARVLVCAANCRQIGTIVYAYQSSNNGRVPPMLNGFSGGFSDVPVKMVWLSVALRDYSGLKVQLPGNMNPEQNWGLRIMNEYKNKYLPKFFVCPLGRGRMPDDNWWGPFVPVQIGSKTYYLRDVLGAIDSYVTWLYPQRAGVVFDNHPKGPPNGVRKYGSLNWYEKQSALDRHGNVKPLNVPANLRGAKWDRIALNECGAGTSSSAMISYCNWGQWSGIYTDNTPTVISNRGKHAKQGQGGTNVIFADGHTGWIPGTQIDDTGAR